MAAPTGTTSGGAGGGTSRGTGPSSWGLKAELTPLTDDPDPAPQSGAVDDVVPPAWAESAEGLRTTVKWMVGAFAAVGAVMFAKGFVTTPKLSWDDDKGQLILAWIVGAAGLLALGWLIYLASNVLRPTAFELGNLPKKYQQEIDATPRFYLPGDVDTFEAYLKNLRTLRKLSVTHADDLVRATRALKKAEEEVAKTANKNAAQIKTLDDAKKEVERAQVASTSVDEALAVYLEVRSDLLARAAYWQSAGGFDTAGPLMVAAAVVAAGGGIGYQLLLAPSEDTQPASSPPAVGTLIRTDTAAGLRLWTALNLRRCQADSTSEKRADSRIPVIVVSGKGSPSEPYVVSTIPSASCSPQTFSVIDEVALVTQPKPLKITYEPEPIGDPDDASGADR